MAPELQKIEGEIIPAENRLAVIIKESGLEESKGDILLRHFQDFFQVAAEWERTAKTIIVTDASQRDKMELARAGRLALKKKRNEIETVRKALKEQSLREGKAIDGIANVLKALIAPIEEHLEKQEKFVELRDAAEKERLRLAAEQKAEEERLAREAEEKAEQERIRADNERLQQENAAKEAELARQRQEADAQLEAERKAAAEALEAERRKAAEAKADAQRKIEEAQKAAEEAKKRAKRQVKCPNCQHIFNLEDSEEVTHEPEIQS